MILLGINGGMGNTDVAELPLDAVDLHEGWIDYPRPKTEVPRRFPLWPETVQAIKIYLQRRPEPKRGEDAHLVFLTKFRQRWVRSRMREPEPGTVVVQTIDSIGLQFNKLRASCGAVGIGRGFYALRHTFRTIADDVRDNVAIDRVMGHETPGIATYYRESIDDKRLLAVTNRVRHWLFTDVGNHSGGVLAKIG